MGTTYNVKVAGRALSDGEQARAREAVQRAFDDVVGRMSTFESDSELSRFNRHRDDEPFALSRETLAVLALAQRVSAASGGAFDVTVAPLVDAWGFGPGRMNRVVGEAEIGALEARVGWKMLVADPAAGTASKARPDLRADLSGIAKGYGVDRAARALEALAITDYVVEAGGEVRARGLNAEAIPWRIGIEQPDVLPRRAHFVLPLHDLSMATSGDYRIFFERDGQRYCHEIDPATGRPIRHGLASVTVVAADCAYADAMATALIVMGPDKGAAFATARGLAAYFMVRRADGSFSDLRTPALAALGGSVALAS
jgi:thiamine biosynthesis lipoprotein